MCLSARISSVICAGCAAIGEPQHTLPRHHCQRSHQPSPLYNYVHLVSIVSATSAQTSPLGERHKAPQKISFDVSPQLDAPKALLLDKLSKCVPVLHASLSRNRAHRPKLTCPVILKLTKIADFVANELEMRVCLTLCAFHSCFTRCSRATTLTPPKAATWSIWCAMARFASTSIICDRHECVHQVLDPQLDLATVKFRYWRKVDETRLMYRRKSANIDL